MTSSSFPFFPSTPSASTSSETMLSPPSPPRSRCEIISIPFHNNNNNELNHILLPGFNNDVSSSSSSRLKLPVLFQLQPRFSSLPLMDFNPFYLQQQGSDESCCPSLVDNTFSDDENDDDDENDHDNNEINHIDSLALTGNTIAASETESACLSTVKKSLESTESPSASLYNVSDLPRLPKELEQKKNVEEDAASCGSSTSSTPGASSKKYTPTQHKKAALAA